VPSSTQPSPPQPGLNTKETFNSFGRQDTSARGEVPSPGRRIRSGRAVTLPAPFRGTQQRRLADLVLISHHLVAAPRRPRTEARTRRLDYRTRKGLTRGPLQKLPQLALVIRQSVAGIGTRVALGHPARRLGEIVEAELLAVGRLGPGALAPQLMAAV